MLQHLSTRVPVFTTSLSFVGEAFGLIVVIVSTLGACGLKIGFAWVVREGGGHKGIGQLAVGAPLTHVEEEMFASTWLFPETWRLFSTNNVCSCLALLLHLSPSFHALGCVACGLGLFAPFPTCLLLWFASILFHVPSFSTFFKVYPSESMTP